MWSAKTRRLVLYASNRMCVATLNRIRHGKSKNTIFPRQSRKYHHFISLYFYVTFLTNKVTLPSVQIFEYFPHEVPLFGQFLQPSRKKGNLFRFKKATLVRIDCTFPNIEQYRSGTIDRTHRFVRIVSTRRSLKICSPLAGFNNFINDCTCYVHPLPVVPFNWKH